MTPTLLRPKELFEGLQTCDDLNPVVKESHSQAGARGEHWGKAKNTSLWLAIDPPLGGLAQLRRNRDLVKCGISAGHGYGGDKGSVAWLKIIFVSSFVVQRKGSDGLGDNLRLGVFDIRCTFILMHKTKDFVIIHNADIGLGQRRSAANFEGKGVSHKDDPILGIVTQFLQ